MKQMKSWDRLDGKYRVWQFSTATSCGPLLFNAGIDRLKDETDQAILCGFTRMPFHLEMKQAQTPGSHRLVGKF